MGSASPQVVTILHFNDVYNIEEREVEPKGGAARFVTAIKNRSELNPMVLFSGDAFAPSISKFQLKTIYLGKLKSKKTKQNKSNLMNCFYFCPKCT